MQESNKPNPSKVGPNENLDIAKVHDMDVPQSQSHR